MTEIRVVKIIKKNFSSTVLNKRRGSTMQKMGQRLPGENERDQPPGM